jgi:hypothetical protein
MFSFHIHFMDHAYVCVYKWVYVCIYTNKNISLTSHDPPLKLEKSAVAALQRANMEVSSSSPSDHHTCHSDRIPNQYSHFSPHPTAWKYPFLPKNTCPHAPNSPQNPDPSPPIAPSLRCYKVVSVIHSRWPLQRDRRALLRC